MDYQQFSAKVYAWWDGKMTNEPFLASLTNGELSQYITTLRGEQRADAEIARCYFTTWIKYSVLTDEINTTVKEAVDVRVKTIAAFEGFLPKIRKIAADGDTKKSKAMVLKVADYCKVNPSEFANRLMAKYQPQLDRCAEILAFQQRTHEELKVLLACFDGYIRTPAEVSVYLSLWPGILRVGENTKAAIEEHIETLQRLSPTLDEFRMECQAFLNVLE